MRALYSGFANALMETYPASAKVFMEMSEEEHEHRRWLTDLYQKKFGDFIPLIRRSEINGFVKHKPGLDDRQAQHRGDAPARRGH